MATDPRGRWFRVYARQIRQHPKFRALSLTELGAWTAIRSEVELLDGEPLADRADALLILRRHKAPKPAAVLDRLIEIRLIDVTPEGGIAVHDREDHDRPKYPSDDPDEARRRKAEQRAREKTEALSRASHEPVTSVTNSVTTSRTQEAEPATEAEAEPAAEPAPPADELPDESDPITEACRYLPNGGHWLADADYRVAWEDLVRRFGAEWVLEAIPPAYAECLKSGKVRGWDLKRLTEWHLAERNRRDELAAEKAKSNAEQRAATEQRRRIEQATPEEREQAKLQQQAIRLGLQRGIEVPTDPDEVREFVMQHGASA